MNMRVYCQVESVDKEALMGLSERKLYKGHVGDAHDGGVK